MASPNSTFTEMVTSTLRHHPSAVSDNVSDHNGLLNVMKSKGKIKTIGGGYEIAMPLEYAENGTYQRYLGYEQLDTSASDVFTAANYAWKQIALHVTASGREIRQNMSSKERIFDLVKNRVANAKRTAANNMSVDIYSDGTATNQIGGLGALVTVAGTGTVGGIDSSSETWWKNQVKEASGTDVAGGSLTVAQSMTFMTDMNDLWLACVRGNDRPDCIVFTHDFYALYELGQQDKQRYASSRLAAAGFETLKYKSADILFDSNTNFAVGGETGYFLNTDYLYLVQHREAQWSTDDEKKPVNQDAVVIPLFWMGNMVCTNRAVQGRLFDEA